MEPAPVAIKLIEPDENEDWQPRKTAQAFQEQMRALQKATMAKARGEQPGEQEQQADFDDTRPPEEEHEEATSKVVSLKDWRVRYYHNDHLGTPRELSDEDGGIVWQATYKAWGNTLKVEAARPTTLQNQELLAQTGRRAEAKNDPNAELQPFEQNLRFQGQYFDQETGLHYNRFRYYDPDVGRFVSQDPIAFAGGDNFYQYAPNPITWIDPGGLNSAKLDRRLGGRARDCHQAHHLIPEEVMDDPKYKTMFDRLKNMGFDPDGAGNGIHLPSTEQLAKQTGLPGHWSSHDQYTVSIDQKVNSLYNQWKAGRVSDMQLLLGTKEIQNQARSDISNGRVRVSPRCRLI